MLKCRFALVFLVVLVVYLQQSQGFHLGKKKAIKAPIVAAKVGITKAVATKIKLATLKKWAAAKAVIKAPFILGKKAVLLKIGAIKSLAALKAAKAKKALGLAAEKIAPVKAAALAIPAAAIAIPAAAAVGLPASIAALIPNQTPAPSAPEPLPEVVDTYTIPVKPSQVAVPHAEYGSSFVGSYKDESKTPQTYANGYRVNLFPGGETSSTYQYYPIPDTSYGVVETHHSQGASKREETDTEVIVPHNNPGTPHVAYGVPN